MADDVTSALVPKAPIGGLVVPYEEAAQKARAYAEASRADSTLKRYNSAWKGFCAWANAQELETLPAMPQTVAAYFAARDDQSIRTLEVTRSAIGAAHRAARLDNPCEDEAVRLVLQGIRRVRGVPPKGKDPLLTEEIRQLIDSTNMWTQPRKLRGRAVLLLGFTGAFRRSELSALNWSDVVESPAGLTVTLRRSKTDQQGHGRNVGIKRTGTDLCPVEAFNAWKGWVISEASMRLVPDVEAVFHGVSKYGRLRMRLRPQSIATVVKDAAEQAGLDPDQLGGHSLRSGFATQAALNGVAERAIVNQTGHKNLNTLRKYIRMGTLFQDNASGDLGL